MKSTTTAYLQACRELRDASKAAYNAAMMGKEYAGYAESLSRLASRLSEKCLALRALVAA